MKSTVSETVFVVPLKFIEVITGTSPIFSCMGDWKDQTGLSESTDVAKIYVREDIKQEWKDEAEEYNRSLSKHLFYLIREARLLRNEGIMNPTLSVELDEDVDVESPGVGELEEKISELERRVQELKEENRSQSPENTRLMDIGLAQQVLTEKCSPLDDLVDVHIEYPEFRNRVRSDLKKSLFRLGAEGEADYVRGHGWRLEE